MNTSQSTISALGLPFAIRAIAKKYRYDCMQLDLSVLNKLRLANRGMRIMELINGVNGNVSAMYNKRFYDRLNAMNAAGLVTWDATAAIKVYSITARGKALLRDADKALNEYVEQELTKAAL